MNLFMFCFVIFKIALLTGCSTACTAIKSCDNIVILEDLVAKFSNVDLAANRESLCKLGLKTGFIPDSAFSASSELARAYKASNARLDRQEIEVPLQVGAWLSETNTVGEWLQINLNNLTTITGVITQARNTELHWVTKFNIDYKSEGNGNWNVVRDASSNTEFRGNQDNYTKKTNMFDQPVQAIQIRLTVLEWQTRIALRLEYLTC